ncbi:RPS6 [Symbiodinium natans]|uniref:RPS6 protein n=1 Tax=Symbiodinium natans TaxID=878477 RepID=A0A812LLK9_9DINO|nr:RPS6 [Symbiodinium natans]
MVYKCFGRASRCSGGPPGSCAPGRDPATVTCNDCLPGRMPLQDGSCGPCIATSFAVFGFVVLALVFGIALVYVVLALHADRATQPGHLFLGVVAVSQLVTLIQQLVVVSKLGIEWHAPVDEILKSLAIFGVDLDMIALPCVATVGPVLKYVLTVSVAPILAGIALALHLSAVAYKRYVWQGLKVRLDSIQLLRTLGSLVSLLFIGIFTALVAPFQCNSHPNGRKTIQQYASVFCNLRDAHLQMSVIGAVACLMPLCFLAVCIWIICVELPKRVLRADATYYRACSFLWLRFRPGGERFAIFMLVRNALMVLCPLLPSVSVKLAALNVLLYLSLIAMTLSQPWRVPASNVLDTLLHVGLLVVLYMASLFAGHGVDDASLVQATAISLFFMLMMPVAVAVVVLYGLGLHFVRRSRKPWHFFLSHHKRAAGSFARLLKIQLQQRKQRGAALNAFLDTDNLRDLTELFNFVQDSETFVILASPGILARKWCVGEIVTAKLHKVHTVIVRWPNFTDPTATMHENLSFAIPGVEALTAYSISLHDVSSTLRWIKTLESFSFPHSLDAESIGKICDALTGGVLPSLSSLERKTARPDCVILVDPRNQEAVATAHVLLELLRLGKEVRLSPVVLKAGDRVPDYVAKALLVCSSGCFQSEALASWLIRLPTPKCAILPILAEPDFAVPTEPFENAAAGVAGAFTDSERAAYAQVLEVVFQEIASVLAPQSYSSTQEDLELRAKQIAFRLQSKGSSRRIDTGSVRSIPGEVSEGLFRI